MCRSIKNKICFASSIGFAGILLVMSLGSGLLAENINYKGYSFKSSTSNGPVSKIKDPRKIKNDATLNLNENSSSNTTQDISTSSSKPDSPKEVVKKQNKQLVVSSKKNRESKTNTVSPVTKPVSKPNPSVISIKANYRHPSLPFSEEPMKVSSGYINN